ncbi:Retrotransposon gag protein [Rhizoctonia solani]|uniref:Retrotransposon gag protein n=1 Tax=Rhizoctonia solani TaxID=456999 RepID=A0A8H7LZ75_9AGAM|nr:Retrotransposon gag protein [Rhizoctonia solani]
MQETADLLGDKDQGAAQAKPGHRLGLSLLPPTREEPTLQARRQGRAKAPQKEPQGTPRRHLGSLTPFDAGSSAKRPKMDLPDPYKGDIRGRKATQWLDQMLLWVALHREQFDEEEQMVVLCQPQCQAAAARKIATLAQTSTTSEYVTEFRNLIAELDWNKEAYIAQFTRGLHWKVKELLSTKDSIPDKLEAIFAAAIKIDNIRRKNKETGQRRVQLSEDPNYVTPEERDAAAHQAVRQMRSEGPWDQAVPKWLESHG